MAVATLALTSPTLGNAWTITISNINGSDQVKDTTKYSSSVVSSSSPSFSFSINSDVNPNNNKVNGYSGSGLKYVTWRSALPAGQYQTSGVSLDLWNDSLYDKIITNSNTWTAISTGGSNTYSLREDKWSLIYHYDSLYSPIYSKGGTLTITVD